MEAKRGQSLRAKSGSDAELKAALRILKKTDEKCAKSKSRLQRYGIIIADLKRVNTLLEAALNHPNVEIPKNGS